MGLQFAPDAFEQPYPKLLMRHFTSAITQRDFGFIAFFEESQQVADLDFVVALVSAGPEFHFLDHNLLLLQLGFVLAFALTVFELAKIHDAADGRYRRRRNFHQIQFGFFGQLVGRRYADNTYRFTVYAN